MRRTSVPLEKALLPGATILATAKAVSIKIATEVKDLLLSRAIPQIPCPVCVSRRKFKRENPKEEIIYIVDMLYCSRTVQPLPSFVPKPTKKPPSKYAYVEAIVIS